MAFTDIYVSDEYKEYVNNLPKLQEMAFDSFLSTADEYYLSSDGILAFKKNSEQNKESLFADLESLKNGIKNAPENLSLSIDKIKYQQAEDSNNLFSSDRYTPPRIELSNPDTIESNPQSNNLLDVMKDYHKDIIDSTNNQTDLLKTQNEINKKLSDSLHSISESLKAIVELKSTSNSIDSHSAMSNSSINSSIANSLTALPTISKSLDTISQTSIANLQVEKSKDFSLYDMSVGLSNQTDELKKQTSSIKHQGDYANYMNNGKVTDTAGDTMSPAEARARKDVEFGMTESQINSFDIDSLLEIKDQLVDEIKDGFVSSTNIGDFNIFEYALNVSSEKEKFSNE
jgi:predicted  nucleic acid-binding Zn-ribbon protein